MQPVSPELRARVDRLLARGKTYDQIAKAIGRTKNAVAGIVYTNRNPRPGRKPLRPDLDISLVSDLPTHEARYVLAVTLNLGLSETARLVGRTPQTISYSCRKIEDMRDDPAYDEYLESVEEDKRKFLPGRTPNPRPDPDQISRIAQVVVPKFGVSTGGRDIMLYVVAVSLNYGQSATADVMQVSRRLVYEACQRIEDRRDRADFDAELTEVEELLTQNTPGY